VNCGFPVCPPRQFLTHVFHPVASSQVGAGRLPAHTSHSCSDCCFPHDAGERLMHSTQPEVRTAARLPRHSVGVSASFLAGADILALLRVDTMTKSVPADGQSLPPCSSRPRQLPRRALLTRRAVCPSRSRRPLAAGFVHAGASAAVAPGSAAARQCCRTSGTSLRDGFFRHVYLSVKAPLVPISAMQLTHTKSVLKKNNNAIQHGISLWSV